MLVRFFLLLRQHQVPVTVRELLDLIALLERGAVWCDQTQFYHLARMCLVKDERFYDRYDLACQQFFEGVEAAEFELSPHELPEEWLRRQLEKTLDEKTRQSLKRHKDLAELMETLAERLKQQKSRHQGGNRMIGTGGTSPFGAYGDHPEGVRIGGPSRRRSAVKVWENRRFKALDHRQQLDTRSFKLALKSLRQWARKGPQDQLNIDETLKLTAKQGGWLELAWQAERHNAVKVVIFFDVGGSMDSYVSLSQRLFAAANTEFKHLKFFYFHNMIYESVWQTPQRIPGEAVSVSELLRTFAPDYRVIFVGDAAMAPYELLVEGGSIEHWNKESGQVWLQRVLSHFQKVAWLNPHIEGQWAWYETIGLIEQILDGRMYPLTLTGIQAAVSALK